MLLHEGKTENQFQSLFSLFPTEILNWVNFVCWKIQKLFYSYFLYICCCVCTVHARRGFGMRGGGGGGVAPYYPCLTKISLLSIFMLFCVHVRRGIGRGGSTLSIIVMYILNLLQWNLVIKRLDITKPCYNKVICWSQLFICLCFFTLI